MTVFYVLGGVIGVLAVVELLSLAWVVWKVKDDVWNCDA
jgi:hypothetical protein